MQFVSALDRVPRMRGVLGLFEGVCSGAADGYARMAGKPAATLLHLGPGLANALSNLHNARKARSPGSQYRGRAFHAAPGVRRSIDADIEASRGRYRVGCEPSKARAPWVKRLRRLWRPPWGRQASRHADRACRFLMERGRRQRLPARHGHPRPLPDSQVVRNAVRALRTGPRDSLLLGGTTLQERGLRAADRIRAATGVRVFGDRHAARMTRGAGIPAFERIPYFPEQAQQLLADVERLYWWKRNRRSRFSVIQV